MNLADMQRRIQNATTVDQLLDLKSELDQYSASIMGQFDRSVDLDACRSLKQQIHAKLRAFR